MFMIQMEGDVAHALHSLVGLAFGGSLISIFARLAAASSPRVPTWAPTSSQGGSRHPEDDPRNPAVIADNVGDNVGDCAGMAADLFETYAVTVVATMLLAGLTMTEMGLEGVLYPLVLGAVSIVASIVGTFFVKVRDGGKIMNALYRGIIVSGVIAAICVLVRYEVDDGRRGDQPVPVLADRPRPDGGHDLDHRVLHRDRVRAGALRGGRLPDRPRTNVSAGLAVSMKSTALPVLAICAAIWGASRSKASTASLSPRPPCSR